MKKPVPVITLLLLVVAAAILYHLWEKGREEGRKVLKVLPDHVDMQVRDAVYTDVSADGSKWEIKAKTATYFRRDKTALFDDVAVKMISAEGRTFLMTGRQGRLWTESRDMDIRGEVVIVSDQGDRISMDDLIYSDKEKTLRTDSEVTLENAKTKLQGKGMKISLATRRIELMSRVKAVIK